MGLFNNIGSTFEKKEIIEAFARGKSLGLSEGITIGMQKHFQATSELTEQENELLIQFLIRHNFVLCYDLNEGGFRVRKNNVLNPTKESVVTVVEEPYTESLIVKTVTNSIVEQELIQLGLDAFKKR